MPRLSIIVPVYKVEQYIHKCVDSILNQTFTDFELILVDDGSPDNCGKICDEYVQKDRRVRVIHKENGGLSDARNFGIDAAKGTIIGFVDSDDDIDLDMYKSMIDYLDDNNLDVVCADTYVIRNNKRKFSPRYSENKVFTKKEGTTAILNGSLDNAAWNKIYKRCVIGDVRYPKGRVYEDVATTYKFLFAAKRIGYVPKPFYNYYKRKGSIVASSFNSKSRYDCFLGYRERLLFAIDKELDCVKECRTHALSTALSTLTAFYANNENESSDRYLDLNRFIKENQVLPKKKMRSKDSILLWGFNNCRVINKMYAVLSGLAKKV